ncbi:hypothetical protein [Caniella muris]|uniref:hypothetical protein n=1 Tax=Caniella muris TaxID=2941502 RepID=UPI00203C53DC|nr:hypothetical protein [Caniella muris]
MVGALFYKSLMFIKRSSREAVWIGFAYFWFFGLIATKPFWITAFFIGYQSAELFIYGGSILAVSMQFYSLIVRDDIKSGFLQRVCLEKRPLLGYIVGAAALPALMGFAFGISLIVVYCAVDGFSASALIQYNGINVIILISGLVTLAASSAPSWGLVFGDSDEMQVAYIVTVLAVLMVAVLAFLPRFGVLGVSVGLWAVSVVFFGLFWMLSRHRFRSTGVLP